MLGNPSLESEHVQKTDYLEHIAKAVRDAMLDVRFGRHLHKIKPHVKRTLASRALKHFPIKPHVEFINNNDNHTIMEVLAQNQPGLLHKVALCLLENNIRLVNARVETFGERVEDVFFITLRDGNLITDKSTMVRLSRSICESLDTRTKQTA